MCEWADRRRLKLLPIPCESKTRKEVYAMKIRILMIQAALLFGAWFITTDAFAKELFHITARTPTDTVSRSYGSIGDVIDDFDDQGLRDLIDNYTPDTPVWADITFRGLEVSARYLPESNQLIFQIPDIGFNKTFGVSSSNRAETQQELENFLKDNEEGILKRIVRGMVAKTPIDPIAGNPASLTGRMISDSFAAGAEGFRPERAALCCSKVAGCIETEEELCKTEEKLPSRYQSFGSVTPLGLAVGYYKAGDYKQKTLTLPLSSTVYLNHLDPPLQLRFDLPLNYSRVNDADIYGGALGVSLRIPIIPYVNPDGTITDIWTLTPGIRGGIAASSDLIAGSAGSCRNFDQQLDVSTE